MVGKSVTLALAAAALASTADASPFGWRPPFWFPPEHETSSQGGFWPGFPGFGWGSPTYTVSSTSSSVHTTSTVHTTSSVKTSSTTAVPSSSKTTVPSTSTSKAAVSSSKSTISTTSIATSSSTSVVVSTSVSTGKSSAVSVSVSSKTTSSSVSTPSSSKLSTSSGVSSVVSSVPASSSVTKSSGSKSACSRRTSKSLASSSAGTASASKSAPSSSASGSASASKSVPSASGSASSKPASSGSASKSPVSASTSTTKISRSACSRRTSTTGLGGSVLSTRQPYSTSSKSACSARPPKSTASGSASLSSASKSASLSAPYPSGSASKTVASGSVTSIGLAPSGTSSLSPCGSISKLLATSTRSAGQTYYTVPAQLGYACLNSIPFNSSAAVAYLDSIRPYLNWQTTIEYLEDPPAEYAAKVQPAYDFTGNFERIYSTAVSNSYASEYAFGHDVYILFQTAHDGHFVIYPDSVAELITFGRKTPIVSVSVDGTSIPEIFLYSDIVAASFSNGTFTPSSITQINGQDSVDYLLQFAQIGSLQDRDALWNNIFYEPAQVALGSAGTGTGTFTGSGRGRFFYPDVATALAFANGTVLSNNNFARVLVSFANITSGEDLYQQYLVPPAGEPQGALLQATSTSSTPVASSTVASSTVFSSSAAATTAATATVAGIPAPGYPSPYIREMNNLNSGYFLSGAGYDDVAVLAVNSFVGTLADEIPFQSVNTYLINQAVKFNKTKLIIDVSANGGGTILQGYDLFKQLFPTIQPDGYQRFRAHDAVNLVGEEFSAYSELVPRSLNTNDTVQNIVSSVFNYMTDDDINLQPFTSWAEKYGPFAYGPQPDNFSSTFRWNLSDVLTPDNSGGIYVSGYLNRSNITTQPFAAENIVVVTDGYCASTCTIFSELMRQQGGVKYVALGGRPNTDITQAVGGVKGTNDLEYIDILSSIEQVFVEPLLETREYYNNTVLGGYNDLALVRSAASVVNFRDGLRKGDPTNTPLQFIYEPADCRIFYTPEMTVDISASWKAVADSAWNGVNHCVAGSLAEPSASSKARKRTVNKKHVHSEHEKRVIYDSIANVHSGQGNVHLKADSVMII